MSWRLHALLALAAMAILAAAMFLPPLRAAWTKPLEVGDPSGEFARRISGMLMGDSSAGTVNAPISWKAGRQPQPVSEGTFEILTRVPQNALVTVHYLVPRAGSSEQAVGAPFWLVYCPFPREDKFFQDPVFRTIAEYARIPVFGMLFTGMTEKDVDHGARDQCYYFPESGSQEAVLEAAGKLLEITGAKSPAPLVAFGESGGGSWALNLLSSAPGRVRMAVSLGGRFLPDAAGEGALAVLASTLGDVPELVSANDRLATSIRLHRGYPLRIRSMPVWSLRGGNAPLFHHCPNDQVKDFSLAYIDGLAQLVRKLGRFPHTDSEWPIACASGQNDPPMVGKVAAGLAGERRAELHFPSEASWRAYRNLPGEILSLHAGGEARTATYQFIPGHPHNDDRYVLAVGSAKRTLSWEFDSDLWYLADCGMTVLSKMGGGDDLADAADEVLQRIRGGTLAAVLLYNPNCRDILSWLERTSADVYCLGFDLNAGCKFTDLSEDRVRMGRVVFVSGADFAADSPLTEEISHGSLRHGRSLLVPGPNKGISAFSSARIRMVAAAMAPGREGH